MKYQFHLRRIFTNLFLFTLITLIFFGFIFESGRRFEHWCRSSKHSISWICPVHYSTKNVCNWSSHFPSYNNNMNWVDWFESSSDKSKSRFEFQYNNLTLNQCDDQQESNIDLIIMIISKCNHGALRQTIRRTWANNQFYRQHFPSIQLKFLFLVDFDFISKEKIELEHKMHGDIVQIINLPEYYHHVTYREAGIYDFVRKKCKQAKFVLKTDDDIFINLFLLFQTKFQLSIYSLNKTDLNIYGYPFDNGLVYRSSDDAINERYVITDEEYFCRFYPRFLSGFAYLMSNRVCSLLSKAFEKDVGPFPLSDVYFTGLLAEMMGLERQLLFPSVDYLYEKSCSEKFFTTYEKQSFACAASTEHFDEYKRVRSSSLSEYNILWNAVKRMSIY